MITRNGLVIPDDPNIKKELTVRPIENALGIRSPSFKVWRKTTDGRLIVPRYFPSEAPTRDSRPTPDARGNINFTGKLRDQTNQNEAFAAGIKSLAEKGGGVLSLPPGYGKCLGRDTPVIMADGTVKKVQDICTGEKIMGDDSTPRTILSTCKGIEQLYKITPTKGDAYIINESHILSLWCNERRKVIDISVSDYLKSSPWRKTRLVGYKVPISFNEKPVPLDPYMFGYWLGDGASKASLISSQDSTVLHYFNRNLHKYNLYLDWSSKYDYRIKGPKPNYFFRMLKELNLFGNKHIPDIYKHNSRDIRLQVLAGLIDSDGSRVCGGWDFIQKNEKLFDDTLYLARSLGFACYKQVCKKTCTNSSKGRVTGTYYRCSFFGPCEEVPCKIQRKRHYEERKQCKNVLHVGIKIDKIEIGEYFGFEIDGNRRFVLGDFTVTHNTSVSLAFAGHLKLKTLVVVHKEFLANQWRERIGQFCPGATIGRIQGDVYDVQDKDFVIALIQTMCMREFPKDAFDSFGLLIVDEAHHIGAPAFSQFMFKICPKYTLGLTATPERKDGLTRLLYWFLGPEFFRVERTDQKTTRVEVLHYTDDAFKDAPPVTRFGNINMAAMVTTVTEFEERNSVLVERVNRLVSENNRRVLVLSDRREHCFELQRRLGSKSALYIGGMSEKDLAESAKAPVVLATFQLAQEGLDIPELDTCILATPKSDIKQAIGRIMRETPGKKNAPLIIDVVDHWSVFFSMWRKRMVVYRDGGFEILDINSKDEDSVPRGQCLFLTKTP